ncbi:uncharacterized protein LOC114533898 [Dendronephthya gigantea]|uniref:uncharacterized protein LOC114533898 n=1 Tax=Dendronephthya gigantea TaxID=151771 RepID=UPI00106B1A83|nr:uncharacterized protein LOC114533898 [Dendronephthya gigantea]
MATCIENLCSVSSKRSTNTSTDICRDNNIPHVKSSLGFTMYYEMSDDVQRNLAEIVVISEDSNERLDYLEECLMNRKLSFNKADFENCLLKEAEKIFEHGGEIATFEELIATNSEESELGQSICQYFLKGKCRFGDKCFNLHESLPAEDMLKDDLTETTSSENATDNIKRKPQKQKYKVVETEKPGKKPRMKTATDVINRIQWDEKLNPEHFTVGYLDRFLGIIENEFNSFDWEDVTSLDPTVLAIPRHRIQYFKYMDEIVWDKNERLDCVFGSTGSGQTIVDIMKKKQNKNEPQNVCGQLNQ